MIATSYNFKPPSVENALMLILDNQRGMPACMPVRSIDAARWWIKLQRPIAKDEWPKRVPITGKKQINDDDNGGHRWSAPYIDRITVNLQKFLKLKKSDHDFIIAAFDDGCFWNGYNMPFFHGLYEETMIQKDIGIDKYRKRAAKAARGLLSGFITK